MSRARMGEGCGDEPGAGLLAQDGGRHQRQHPQQHQGQNQQHADDRTHHVHGAGGHEIRRNQEQQQRVVLRQGGDAVVILPALVMEVGADGVRFLQGGLDIGVGLALHVLQYLQHVVGLDGVSLGDAVVHPGAVAF